MSFHDFSAELELISIDFMPTIAFIMNHVTMEVQVLTLRAFSLMQLQNRQLPVKEPIQQSFTLLRF